MSQEWEDILALAEDYNPTSPVYISPVSLAIFGYSLRWLQSKWAWVGKGETLDDISDSEWDEIEAAVSELTKEIWATMLGHIVTLATNEIPENMIPCDGGTYNRADYPELWEVLADSLKIDADTFFTPNLSEARIPIGVPPEGVGLEAGGEQIELVVDFLPPHSHDITIIDPGHFHEDLGNSTLAPGLIGEIPALTASVTGGFTLTAMTGISASASDTGGGEPITVPLPPVTGVTFAMVAK